MTKLGVLVVGQSPRPEIEEEFNRLAIDVDLDLRGCLDNLTRDQIAAIAPKPGESSLFTRLPDGSGVSLSKSAVIEHGTTQLDALEKTGSQTVVLLCTGEFPEWADRRVLLPSLLLKHAVFGLQSSGHLGVLSPLASQRPNSEARWSQQGHRVTTVALSPNATLSETESAAQTLAAANPDLLVFDCVSYTRETKACICGLTQLSGVLAITVVARMAAEYLEGYAAD